MQAQEIEKKITQLQADALEAIQTAADLESLEALRLNFLGAKSELNVILRGLSALDKSERPKVGQLANVVKQKLKKPMKLAEVISTKLQ